MVLYDKNSELIGISQDILQFLGYEDIDDFKTYVNDVADLFVEKSGFVHKYKDFSWIHYVLHSGAAKKDAIIKLKNGDEEEIGIRIKEVLLVENNENIGPYYEISFINNTTEENIEIIPEYSTETKKEIEIASDQPLIQKNESASSKEQKTQESFIEDMDEENLSFLKAHELPKSNKEKTVVDFDKIKSFLGFDRQNASNLIREFLDYNDVIAFELYNSVYQKNIKDIKNHTLYLENSAKMLQLDQLVQILNSLKNSNSENVRENFETYIDILEKIKQEII